VVAVLPMLAIPLLMGGITFGEVARTALVALNTLFFSLTAGLCVSSFSRSAQRAVGGTLFLILLVSGLIPLCGGLMLLVDPAFPAVPGFMVMSSGYTYYQAWDAPYQLNPEYFWWSLGMVHGLAWFFLALASLIAPRSWQDRPAGVRKLRWRERWRDWTQRNPVERAAFRKRLLGINPFFWLAARNRLKPFHVWFTLALIASAWFWGLYKMRREWLNFGILGLTAVVLNIVIKTWFAAESGRQLAEERKHGALELLLSTPLTVRDIMRGQSLALQRQFLGPVAAVLFVAFLFMWEGARQDFGDREFQGPYFMFWIGGMTLLPADLVALYYVSMWQAMTARNPNRAASVAVAQILIVPGLAFLAIWLLAAVASARGGEPPGPGFSLGLWFGLGIAADFLFGSLARHKLLTEFRQAAEQPYAARPGFWKRFLSG
jgi:hypothetical protein